MSTYVTVTMCMYLHVCAQITFTTATDNLTCCAEHTNILKLILRRATRMASTNLLNLDGAFLASHDIPE